MVFGHSDPARLDLPSTTVIRTAGIGIRVSNDGTCVAVIGVSLNVVGPGGRVTQGLCDPGTDREEPITIIEAGSLSYIAAIMIMTFMTPLISTAILLRAGGPLLSRTPLFIHSWVT